MAGLTIVAVRRGDELGRATTGIDGEFAVGALPSGSLDLEIRDAAGFLLETRRGVFAGMEPQEFRMWPQGDLVGTVVGLGGASVPGALISVVRDLDVEPTDVAPIHRTVKSDAQGAFSIQDLPSGTYTVLVPGGERTTAVVGGDPVEVHAPAAAAR
ncbi:MAG: carboxypeptidase regulatory-like domain-containing protein [Planctomycetota bacterium]